MKKQLLTFFATSLSIAGFTQSFTFSYTGALDSLVIPNCVDSIIISAWGAEGGTTIEGAAPGKGAFISARMDVSTGDTVYVLVGGQDGFNGGGEGGLGTASDGITDYAGNGGGASDVRIGGTDLTNRMLVAAGGGGGGRNYWNGSCTPCGVAGAGGDGGITDGADGQDPTGYGANNPGGAGKGGTQTAGGDGGLGIEGLPGNPGTLGQGGVGINGSYSVGSGGGGGGYYGGGSGASAASGSGVAGSGGGGGSSYFDPSLIYVNGVAGARSGDGQIIITYILSTPIMTDAVIQSDITLSAVQSGVNYQWLNCGTGFSAVPGATNQVFVASSNGSYAVQLDNGNGCVDTSACFTISEVSLDENLIEVSVYPNPVDDQLTISALNNHDALWVEIIDASGRVVYEANFSGQNHIVNMQQFNGGVYILKLQNEEGVLTTSQIVKN